MVNREKFKTFKNVFDLYTERNLFKLISQHYFEGLLSPVSLGKEANIFLAERNDKSRVIVKIYRLKGADFKKMYDYLKYDTRFKNLKHKKRQVIFSWAQREYINLMKCRSISVNSPTPYVCKDNILVMELIGDKQPAPQLKDALPKNPEGFFKKLIEQMKLLYKNGLVHADLSKFNILNYREIPFLIDFSQCTTLKNPQSEEYLTRDLKNVCDFFKKLGLKIDESKIRAKFKNNL